MTKRTFLNRPLDPSEADRPVAACKSSRAYAYAWVVYLEPGETIKAMNKTTTNAGTTRVWVAIAFTNSRSAGLPTNWREWGWEPRAERWHVLATEIA